MKKEFQSTGSIILDYSKTYLFGIQLAFIELNSYQELMESFLDKEKDEHEKTFNADEIERVAKSYEEYESDYKAYLEDQYLERMFELSELYPHNFRASFLIHIISFIEYELKKICDYYWRVNKTDFSISDLKGNSDIEKAKRYLAKSCKVDFANLNPEWTFIDTYRKVRNTIVHEQGILTTSNKNFQQINAFIQNTSFLKIRPQTTDVKISSLSNQLIITTKEFNSRLLKLTEAFFEKLLIQELKIADSLG